MNKEHTHKREEKYWNISFFGNNFITHSYNFFQQNKGDWDFPGGAVVKNPPAMQGTWVRALVREDPTGCGATEPVRHNY